MLKYNVCYGVLVTCVLLMIGCSGGDHQQQGEQKGEVKYRHAVFTAMAWNFKQMGAVVKGEKPFDVKEMDERSAFVEVLSMMPWDAFPEGSAKGTEAKENNIWTDRQEFLDAAKNLETQTDLLRGAVGEGEEAFKAQFGKTAEACKACHKKFKKD